MCLWGEAGAAGHCWALQQHCWHLWENTFRNRRDPSAAPGGPWWSRYKLQAGVLWRSCSLQDPHWNNCCPEGLQPMEEGTHPGAGEEWGGRGNREKLLWTDTKSLLPTASAPLTGGEGWRARNEAEPAKMERWGTAGFLILFISHYQNLFLLAIKSFLWSWVCFAYDCNWQVTSLVFILTRYSIVPPSCWGRAVREQLSGPLAASHQSTHHKSLIFL